jgi:hypothetical protein
MSMHDTTGAGVSLRSVGVVLEPDGRLATVYDVSPPRHDPGPMSRDVARSWTVIVWLLLLVPPLGLLVLDRRHEISLALRVAVGLVSLLLVAAAWGQVLSITPPWG